MKKILFIALALVMVVALVACSSNAPAASSAAASVAPSEAPASSEAARYICSCCRIVLKLRFLCPRPTMLGRLNFLNM